MWDCRWVLEQILLWEAKICDRRTYISRGGASVVPFDLYDLLMVNTETIVVARLLEIEDNFTWPIKASDATIDPCSRRYPWEEDIGEVSFERWNSVYGFSMTTTGYQSDVAYPIDNLGRGILHCSSTFDSCDPLPNEEAIIKIGKASKLKKDFFCHVHLEWNTVRVCFLQLGRKITVQDVAKKRNRRLVIVGT